MEMDLKSKKKTFSSDFGVAILALSFPLSTLLILAVLNSGSLFLDIFNIFLVAFVLLVIGLCIPIFNGFHKKWASIKWFGIKLKSPATENA
jgi:hypothetical protein